VSYPYCRAYDTITLKCNGESTQFIVGRDEAPEPPDPGSPIATRVCFTVTRAHLEVAQRPDQKLNFSYTVTDQLGNVPDTDAIWSATQTVDEDLAGTRLPAAILREILSEADDESGTIDLGKLAAYLYVIILVRDPRFEVGDFIEATYTGQSPGLPDVVMTVGGNVQADDFGDPERVVLEIPNDKVVSVQTVTVKYVLKRNGEQKYSSWEAKARVIGEAVTVPPVITRVTDSKGEIDNGGTTTETSITITGTASKGQKVQILDGTTSKGEATANVTTGIWTLVVSALNVAKHIFTAKALYGSGQVSAAWVVNVTALLELKPPTVKEAPNNSLNPLTVSAPTQNYVTIVVPANTALPPDGQLSVSWTGAPGTPAGGSYTSPATLVSAGLEIRIPNTVVAFNLGLSVTVSYTLTHGGTSVSPEEPLTLLVQALPQSALKRPTITQADNDGEGPELDVTSLTGNGSARMSDWPLIALGQFVWLHLEGTNADNSVYRKTLWQAPDSKTNSTWISSGFYTHPSIPLADLKNLKNGWPLRMVFKAALGRSQIESEAVTFPERTYTVKTLPAEFQKPSIKEANGSTTLNPVAAKDALTVVLPANAVLLPTDRVIVKWTGASGTPAGGSHTSASRELGQNFEFPIPNSVVAFNLGLSVTVSYTITRGDGDPIPSQTFTLAVQALPQSALNRPTITQADNDGEGTELDVTSLTGNGTMRMSDWPLIAVGQYVWLHLEGTNADNSDYRKTMWQAPSSVTNLTWITIGFYTHTGIPLADLKNLKNGSPLRMVFKAALGRSQIESEAVTFPERTYTVKSVVDSEPEITSVKDPKNVEIPHNGSTVETSVTLTGTASKGQKVQILDGTTSKGEATADATSGIWILGVSALNVAKHIFTAKALYGSGQVSTDWTFTVVMPLSFGADVTLNLPNYSVVRGIPPINPPGNATYTRVGTGGVPPYTYSSASNNVATIDAAGKVRVAGRGTTTLKVTDSKGASATHKITVTGVIMFMRIGNLMIKRDAEQQCIAQGGGLPGNRAQLKAVYDTYAGQTGGIVQAAGWLGNATWTNEAHTQINHSWTVVMSNGQYSFAHATQGPSAVACRIDTTPAPTTEELGDAKPGADISD
jgi:hypothetical protein